MSNITSVREEIHTPGWIATIIQMSNVEVGIGTIKAFTNDGNILFGQIDESSGAVNGVKSVL